MHYLPQTNAPWCDPLNTTSGVDHPINTMNQISDIEELHRQRQYSKNVPPTRAQENGADAPRSVTPQSSAQQYMATNVLNTDSSQVHRETPVQMQMLSNSRSKYSSTPFCDLGNVANQAEAPVQTTRLTELQSEDSRVGDLVLESVDHHITGLPHAPLAEETLDLRTVQQPVATQAKILIKCDQCSKRGRPCNGGQANGQSCGTCKSSKQVCSFMPRKYTCVLCRSSYARDVDLRTHNTKKHKLPSLHTGNESTPVDNTPDDTQTPLEHIQKASQQPPISSDAARPLKRFRNESKRISSKVPDASKSQYPSPCRLLQMQSPQSTAAQQDQAAKVQTDLGRDLLNADQLEMPPRTGLYQPDSPAYRLVTEPLRENSHTPSLSESCRGSPVEITLVQNQPLNNISGQAQHTQTRETSLYSDSFQFASSSQASQAILQQLSSVHLRQIPSPKNPAPYQNANPDIYLQFLDRVMDDNYVERSLRAIRKEVKDYEEFIRGADPKYTSAEVEEQFSFLKEIQPFTCMKEIKEETRDFFASQTSRLVVLWRLLLDVHPTASLQGELIRFELESLELPVVICGTIAYVLLRTIFDEPDRMRTAERTARFESVKQLHGEKFAAESIKHDQLFIQKDRSVDRELRKSARELSELQFYDLLYPLTHWDITNPTTGMRGVHIQKLSSIALKGLRLSRELQARTTEKYSYFWPRPGELFNQNNHIDAEDSQARSQSSRIIRWTLMFGVRASRGEHKMVYAKAIVITMEA